MKISKKIICVLCIAVTLICCGTLISCKGNDDNSDKAKGKYDYVISDFETDREMQSFLWKSMFGRVTITTDPQFVKTGNGSAKMEIYGMNDAEQKPNFTIFTDREFLDRVDYREAIAFELQVYNACEKEYKIYMSFNSNSTEVGKGGFVKEKEFTLKPKSWNCVKYEVDRVDMNMNWGINKVSQFLFRFDNPLDYIPVVYFDNFVAKMDADPLPNFPYEQTRELIKPDVSYTIPVVANTTRSIVKYNAKTGFWDELDLTPDTEFTSEDKAAQLAATSFVPEIGNYKINYSKHERGYTGVVNSVNLVVEYGDLVTMSAENCIQEVDRLNTGKASLSNDGDIKFLSSSTLKMKGARFPEAPYGFTWNTGYCGGLTSMVIYIYNMRDIVTQIEVVNDVLKPKTWNRVEYKETTERGTLVNQAANWKNNSVIKRNSDTGEWSIFFSVLMWDEQYEMYFNAILNKSDTDERVLELKKESDFVAEGKTYELETFSNATWTVSKNNVNIPSLTNAKSIVGEVGQYEVNYSKDFGGGMMGNAKFTLFCDKYGASNTTKYDTDDLLEDGQAKTHLPMFKEDSSFSLVGNTSFNVSLTDGDMNSKQKVGFLWNSKQKGEIESVIFYVYNKGNVNYGLQVGDHTVTRCPPKTWTRVVITGDFNAMADKWSDITPSDWDKNDGSSQVKKNSDGEWLFQLSLWKWEAHYNFNFNVIVNLK